MSRFLDFFKQFFDGQKPEGHLIPFLHEPIDIEFFPKHEVAKWKKEGHYDTFAELILNTYRDLYIVGEKGTPDAITVLGAPYSNGWLIHCEKLDFRDQDYKFLAFTLSDLLKTAGYVIQLAELKSTAKAAGVEMITHYYLKPSLRFRVKSGNEKVNQLFGNITIEYKTLNGKAHEFKFLAKSYADSKYLPPQDFSEINTLLFRN